MTEKRNTQFYLDRIADIEQLRSNSMTYKEIGRKLGISISRVRAICVKIDRMKRNPDEYEAYKRELHKQLKS